MTLYRLNIPADYNFTYLCCMFCRTFRLTVDCWSSMKPGQRRKAVEACFKRPGVPTSTSTDGSLTVPTTPGGGKKPHQKKRSRVARTTSWNQPASKRVKMSDVEPDSDFE